MIQAFRLAAGLCALCGCMLPAQTPAPAEQKPAVVSPEIRPDRTIVFRLYAPNAQSVAIREGDIPKPIREAIRFAKSENGVWEAQAGPLEPGAYRYVFHVDGVPAADPRNPDTSESNTAIWSLVAVPGSDLTGTRNVPHGAVAEVFYHSRSLSKHRRMHVYTPPGYENGKDKYPVLYLLHGNSDSDDSWSSVGRAGFILDNLIADGKAVPMIVAMPAGHTERVDRLPGAPSPAHDAFFDDFQQDIAPLIQKRYRVYTDRSHTAIAGLSMGGRQGLNLALANLKQYGYIGVFSSSAVSSSNRAAPSKEGEVPLPFQVWEQENGNRLNDREGRKGLKLLWLATGVDDAALPSTRITVEILKKHGFAPVLKETPGAHTWIVWRAYLGEFAPQLFR